MNNDGARRTDTDKEVNIDLMNSRIPFLKMCREQGWRFSSPKEATVSEFCVYKIHLMFSLSPVELRHLFNMLLQTMYVYINKRDV